MTRLQQRLNARYARDPSVANRDALIGDALHRYHAARLTPTSRSVQKVGIYATARQMCNNGTHFIDAYASIFSVMPRRA